MHPGDALSAPVRPVRVLIADREDRLRSALRLLLHDCCSGVVVGEAGDAYEALDTAQVWLPDVVLLGWTLARPRGGKLIRDVRKALPGVVILVLGIQPEARDDALQWGADGFINQGEPPVALLETLQSYCALM